MFGKDITIIEDQGKSETIIKRNLIGYGGSFKRVYKDLEKYVGVKMLYNILHKASSSEMKFYSFYLPDFYHIVCELLDNKKYNRRLWSGRNLYRIREELERLPLIQNIRIIQRTDAKDIPVRNKVQTLAKFNNIKLFDYQDRFIDECLWKSELLGLKGYLLDAAPGTGKTILSLSLMETLGIEKIIVISPKKAVNDVWDETITRIYKEKQTYSMSLDVIHGESKKAGFNLKDRFLVCHYESLNHLLNAINEQGIEYGSRYGIILDECHNFNTHNSERSTAFRKLNELVNPEFCLWMSGTPLKALGSETMTMFTTIDKLFTANVYKSFVKVFGVSGVYAATVMANRLQLVKSSVVTKGSGVEVFKHQVKIKLKNGDDYTLKEISKRMIEYVKGRKEYYQKNYQFYEKDYFDCIEEHRLKSRDINGLNRYLQDAKELHKHYSAQNEQHKILSRQCNEYEDKVIIPTLSNQSKKIFRKSKSVYKYVALTIMGEALGNILGKTRSRCNVDMVNQFVSDAEVIGSDNDKYNTNLPDLINGAIAKTLIFTDYVEVVKSVNEQLLNNDFKPICIFGETTLGGNLARQTKSFKDNENINPLITTYKTLSEAVPLTEANRIIMLNLPFRSGTYSQAVARANRLGQKHDVDLFEVTLDTGEEPNISTRSADILKWSEEQVALILGTKVPDDLELSHEVFSYTIFEEVMPIKPDNGFKQELKTFNW